MLISSFLFEGTLKMRLDSNSMLCTAQTDECESAFHLEYIHL